MKNLLWLSICLFSLVGFGQNAFGEIKGKVFDKETGEPVIGAHVSVKVNGSVQGSATDVNGKYTIKPLPVGTYDLTISHLEYQTTTISGAPVNADEIYFAQDINLEEATTEIIPELVVEAKVDIVEKESHNKIDVNAKQIKQMPVKFDINQLAVAAGGGGVQVSQDGNEIYFRGSRNGDVIYLVDGVKITGGKPLLPSVSINKLSVYTGGLPAKYGDTMGGVIAVETKSYFDLYYESLRDQ